MMRITSVVLSLLACSAGVVAQSPASSSQPVPLKPAQLPVTVLVQNMERSRRFYSEVLGQKIKSDNPQYVTFEAGFSLWLADRAASAIGPAEHPVSATGSGFELVFESTDLDSVLQRLKQADAKLVHEIREMPWGQRVLRFYDPDGHMVEAGEPMSIVLRRLLNQGMSPEDVARRTAVPLDEVKQIASGK